MVMHRLGLYLESNPNGWISLGSTPRPLVYKDSMRVDQKVRGKVLLNRIAIIDCTMKIHKYELLIFAS